MVNTIKQLNKEKKALANSKEYQLGRSISTKIEQLRKLHLKALTRSFKNHRKTKQYKKCIPAISKSEKEYFSDYFSDKRIAVYTCITGHYDAVTDPQVFPDNCDYYMITDMPEKYQSKWNTIDICSIDGVDNSMSNAMKNRFVKMHPEVVFPEYEYSIYVDGNIRICTDMTEYINRMSHYGMAFFAHDLRECVYDEINACRILGKANERDLSDHYEYLRASCMPEHYGLPTCCVIARKHNDPLCQKIMHEWWAEYVNHAKRDQLSLPLVLYRNKIQVQNVTTLGNNVYLEDSFEFTTHA